MNRPCIFFSVILAPAVLAGSAAAGTISGLTYTPQSFPGYALNCVVGPDGNVWLTDPFKSQIGRLVPSSGAYTAFNTLTPNAGTDGITVGPDGNIWFTEGSKVGRITTSGTMTEFPLPQSLGSSSFPLEILTGPDGNLWFTAGGNPSPRVLVRMDTSGNVLGQIPPPSGVSFGGFGFSQHLAPGPDGNVWFTDLSNNEVGKITPQGVVTAYAIPTPNRGNVGGRLVTGPDGNVWFTHANAVDRVTPAGVITEFSPPTANSAPSGIAAGSDGNIWFNEYNGDQLARLVLSSISGSTATIDESGFLTAQPTVLRLFPPPAGRSSMPLNATSCLGLSFIVVNSASVSGGNMGIASLPATGACADLAITISGSLGESSTFETAAEPFVFSVSAQNSGPDLATNVSVAIQCTLAITEVSTIRGPLFCAGPTCTAPSLAVGRSSIVFVKIENPPALGVSCHVSISSTTSDPKPSNNAATAHVDVFSKGHSL